MTVRQGVVLKINCEVKIGNRGFFFLGNQWQVGLSNRNEAERGLFFVACTTKSNAIEE
jgi:hypothetical protein